MPKNGVFENYWRGFVRYGGEFEWEIKDSDSATRKA